MLDATLFASDAEPEVCWDGALRRRDSPRPETAGSAMAQSSLKEAGNADPGQTGVEISTFTAFQAKCPLTRISRLTMERSKAPVGAGGKMAILPSSGFALVALLAGAFLDIRTPAVADETPERRPAVVRLTPDVICEVLAKTAASNGLPVDFFTRLIWQESRFKPDAVSPAGAQGIAQFMPQTARMRGLEDPFDPLEAIAKSAELLRDLNQDLGNFGLAAAAYNAGPARVRDWMSARRALPRETNAYVLFVTGHPIEDWSSPPIPDMSVLEHVPCDQFAAAFP
jgi:hypothetical protein